MTPTWMQPESTQISNVSPETKRPPGSGFEPSQPRRVQLLSDQKKSPKRPTVITYGSLIAAGEPMPAGEALQCRSAEV